MIPVDFDYVRPTDLATACALLAGPAGDAVALMAGGQSLMTELKLRNRRPGLVLDLGGIDALKAIERSGDRLRIGAMVSQAELARNDIVRERLPVLIDVAAVAGDPMVRRRGTLVGAICQADPKGDWLAACLVLDASVEIRRGDTLRETPIQDFVAGAGQPTLQPDELVTGLRVSLPAADVRGAYRKVRHTAIGWSIAGVAVAIRVDQEGRCVDCRLAASGALHHPQRLTVLEGRLEGMPLNDQAALRTTIDQALAALRFQEDRHASAEHRATRLSVLIERTLAELATRDR